MLVYIKEIAMEDILTTQEDDEQKQQFVVGLDIGYGNVKMSYGYAGKNSQELSKKLTTKVFPATFQKFSATESPFYQVKGKEKFVSFNGNNYLVFASDSAKLPTFANDRCLDNFYPKTDQYMVLFLGSLLEIGKKEIDLLVIGLPVNQANNPEKVEYVKERLTGTFKLNQKGTSVTVKRVEVIRQPIGAFFNSMANGLGKMDQSTLFCDIGFYSTDWVLMLSRSIQTQASGSTANAVSNIIEDVAFKVGMTYGNTISSTRFEDAIREGKHKIESAKHGEIDFEETFKSSTEQVVSTVLRQIKGRVRSFMENIDNIIVVGGGAAYFEDAIKEYFPEQRVICVNDSVTANASGFYWYGVYLLTNGK